MITAQPMTLSYNFDELNEESKAELQRDIEVALMRSLAAYVLLRRKDPVCVLLEDLFKLEAQTGAFLGDAIKDLAMQSKMKGTLAGVLSVIPISSQGISRN